MTRLVGLGCFKLGGLEFTNLDTVGGFGGQGLGVQGHEPGHDWWARGLRFGKRSSRSLTRVVGLGCFKLGGLESTNLHTVGGDFLDALTIVCV